MAITLPSFNNGNQQQSQQQGYAMFNPHQASMMGGIGAMNNLGSLIGQSFAGANRVNSSNRINNNAINAASGGGGGGGVSGDAAMAFQFDFMKELMRQQSENQRQQQKMQMAQQLMGMMGGMPAGPQLAGFSSNFGQGVNLFGTPPAATAPGQAPAGPPAPTPGQPGGAYGPYANPFHNDILGQQMARINSLRNRTAQPGQHPRFDSHYGMNLAMGSPSGTAAGIPPMNMQGMGGRLPGMGGKSKPQPTRKPARPGFIDVTTDV